MQAENDDDLGGGQRSEVKWGELCAMAAIFGQKKWWCKLRMMMTLMEVKGHQRSNGVNYVLWLPYLVKKSRWGLGPKVCMHHFGCGNGMNWIKGYYMIVKVKNLTFWFSTYSMEMHSLTWSSFIICLWGETFGSRTILLHCSCLLWKQVNIWLCLPHALINFNQSWVIDVTWGPSFVDEVRGHISRSKVIWG